MGVLLGSINYALDVAAFDLLGQLLDELGNARQVRMHVQSAAEDVKRAFVVADLVQHHAEPGESAEMTRLARQNLADIDDRAVEVLFQEIDGRAPIPGFGIVGLYLDDGVEQPEGKVKVAALERRLDAAHQQVGGIAAGS